MKNVYINEAETILEPFWDGGDSYPNHEKYACIRNYSVQGDGYYEQGWDSARIYTTSSVTLFRNINIRTEEFDTIMVRLNLPAGMRFLMYVVIDGKREVVIDENRELYEFEGKINGAVLTKLELTFTIESACSVPASLFWIGFADSEKRKVMLERKNGYCYEQDCWEGCMQRKYEVRPSLEVFLTGEEFEVIRTKVSSGYFKSIFEKLETEAREFMQYEPEALIGDYIGLDNKRFGRSRDFDRKLPSSIRAMRVLAFVGQVNRDRDMLRHACRIALSVANSRYWCEGIRGVFPGATWHHRSFLETDLCEACAMVLDWAGEALTWHGKNIIQDAIIMKGLPRIEADIKTMDYIWKMNQGLAFIGPVIPALMVLAKKYPRYQETIDRYEKDLDVMWSQYVNPDGGVGEGPGYWNFGIISFLNAKYYLARYRKCSVKKYLQLYLQKIEQYARSLLSTSGEGIGFVPINDCGIMGRPSLEIVGFFAEYTDYSAFWKEVFQKTIRETQPAILLHKIALFETKELNPEEKAGKIKKEFYTNLSDSGVVVLKKYQDRENLTALYLQSGQKQTTVSHAHEDQGSVILESKGRTVLIDRGVCDYAASDIRDFQSAKWHNLLYPETGKEEHQDVKHNYSEVKEASYQDGILFYRVDLTKVWAGIFTKYIRTFVMITPKLFLICDSYKSECATSFRLNSYGKMEGRRIDYGQGFLYVHPLNWMPFKEESGITGTDGARQDVWQMRLYSDCRNMITLLELTDAESRVQIQDDNITVAETKITLKKNLLIINQKEYLLYDE